MGIPNENQLKFNSIKDEKSLLQALEKRFGGNVATKKTQMNLLKQHTINTNGAVNTAHGATTASTQATAVNSTTIDNLSDAVADDYANNEGKEILEEHWKECRAPRNQENKNKEKHKRVVPLETTTSNALVSCDCSGYDWSDQAKEGNFMPSKPDQSFSDLEEFTSEPIVIKHVVENNEAKASERKLNEEEDVPRAKIEKKTVKPSFAMTEFVKPKGKTARKTVKQANPQIDLQDKRVIDSGCSRHITRNMSYLTDFEEIDGGYVSFRGNLKGGKITGRGSKLAMMQFSRMRVQTLSDDEKKVDEDPRKDCESIDQVKDDSVNNTNNVNAASTNEVNVVGRKASIELPDEPNMPALEDIVYSDDDEDVGAEVDMNNLDTTIQMDVKRWFSLCSTKKSLCIEFEKMMHKKFQMSSMGELTFFLGLQVKQKEDGIFISQDKYVTKILKNLFY
ncbi:copia protein [Tanacetum coccineum]|uniref:Copia protein n=1 Tax=Tanacetum coccineum TaxID=301880 RepID=A0ABQ5FGS5_9ASTR